MKKQMKKLQILMNLFLETKERFYTEFSPAGADFTFVVEDDVLTVIKDNVTLVVYDPAKNQITHDIETDDFECLIDCMVWMMKELRPEVYDSVETFASEFYHIGRTLRQLRGE
jgi:hypothetical protein